MTYGVNDFARYTNEHGGINGVELKVIWYDVGKTLDAGTISAHKRFKEAGVVFEIMSLSTATEMLAPRWQKDEIPALFVVGYTPAMIT